MMESAALLLSLAHGGTELIFVDEFTFQLRSIKMYGWAEKNSKPVINSLLEPISFSFIIALSYRKYYVHAVSDSTKFKEYLKKLISDIINNMDQNDKKFYIVADNSSIHKTKDIIEFLAKSKISLLTISPYSPWFNPVEHYIKAIKSKFEQKCQLQQY